MADGPLTKLTEALRRVRTARDCDELCRIVNDAQMQFVNGVLTGEDVEVIAGACIRRSWDLPVDHPRPGEICAADLLPGDENDDS
jgi:hypothetical protein